MGHAAALKFSGALYSASAKFGALVSATASRRFVDLHRRQHRAAGVVHQGRAARKRLSGIPHIIGQQDALAGELARVKRAERKAALRVVV